MTMGDERNTARSRNSSSRRYALLLFLSLAGILLQIRLTAQVNELSKQYSRTIDHVIASNVPPSSFQADPTPRTGNNTLVISSSPLSTTEKQSSVGSQQTAALFSSVETAGATDVSPQALIHKEKANFVNATKVSPSNNDTKPFRFLFGIWVTSSKKKAKERKQLQKLLRTKLPSHYRHKNNDASPLVCSLCNFKQQPQLQSDPNSCRILYTFVSEGNPKGPLELFWGSHQDDQDTTNNDIGFVASSNQHLAPNGNHDDDDDDIVLLNIRASSTGNKLATWYSYAASLSTEHPEYQIDFIGEINGHTTFWMPDRFLQVAEENRQFLQYKYVYGGVAHGFKYCVWTTQPAICEGDGRNIKGPLYMKDGFSFVSTALAQYVTFSLPLALKQKAQVPKQAMDWANRVYSYDASPFPILAFTIPVEGPDAPVSLNVAGGHAKLESLYKEVCRPQTGFNCTRMQGNNKDYKNVGQSVTTTTNNQASSSRLHSAGYTLAGYPVYPFAYLSPKQQKKLKSNNKWIMAKDWNAKLFFTGHLANPPPNAMSIIEKANNGATSSLPHHEESATSKRPFRTLFGIFSMDAPTELERRDAIRSTYLSHFRGSSKHNTTICSLSTFRKNPSLQQDAMACQILYTFVLGGNSGGPTELFHENLHDKARRNEDMSVAIVTSSEQYVTQDTARNFSHPTESSSNHDDMTFLNIQENMNEGKTPTWFSYAASLMREYPDYNIDFVGKVDSDTILMPDRYLQILKSNREVFEKLRVYAGEAFVSRQQPQHKTPIFMQGGLYIVSSTIAQEVAFDLSIDQKQSQHAPFEDVDWGNRVFSYGQNPLPITVFNFGPGFPFVHAWDENDPNYKLKDPKQILQRYQELCGSDQNGQCTKPNRPFPDSGYLSAANMLAGYPTSTIFANESVGWKDGVFYDIS